ncbi:hypothetical protein AVEN_176509-1 [Araneus ventricosus]|uniref:Uncharacterized protein n=1 Tax=Araneus ventricosus TaxID=182803 RepID=A0A4Y2C9G3_ARAVE|nr:hypothetical protein AVEN_260613-1 [Araneus ventricosus]GBM01083.1 hypothetical protein AVEN_176509-1 [Araneus ventricosus]
MFSLVILTSRFETILRPFWGGPLKFEVRSDDEDGTFPSSKPHQKENVWPSRHVTSLITQDSVQYCYDIFTILYGIQNTGQRRRYIVQYLVLIGVRQARIHRRDLVSNLEPSSPEPEALSTAAPDLLERVSFGINTVESPYNEISLQRISLYNEIFNHNVK